MSSVEPLDSDVYLDSRAVRRRYGGRSDMSLWRWARDSKLGFPQPIYIGKYRYWRLSSLLDWESTRPTSKPGAA
jgi:predicted DNA-binding transcriptional regulator AlpA